MASNGTSIHIKTEIKCEYNCQHNSEVNGHKKIKVEKVECPTNEEDCCLSCGNEYIVRFVKDGKIKREIIDPSPVRCVKDKIKKCLPIAIKQEMIDPVQATSNDGPQSYSNFPTTGIKEEKVDAVSQSIEQAESFDGIHWVCPRCQKEFPIRTDFVVHKKYCRTYLRSNLKRCSKELDEIAETNDQSKALNESAGQIEETADVVVIDTKPANYKDDAHDDILTATNPTSVFCTICKNYFADKGRFTAHKNKKLCIAFEYASLNSGKSLANSPHNNNTLDNKEIKFGVGAQPEKPCQIIIINKSVSCIHCSDLSFSQRQLTDHLMFKHIGVRSYSCMPCKKTFQSKEGLLYHLYNSSVHSRTLYLPKKACKDCGIIFKTKGALEYHRHVVHSSWKYSCADCKRVFNSKRALKGHQNMYCPFFRPDSLMGNHTAAEKNDQMEDTVPLFQHYDVNQHGGPFKCCECNDTFKSRRGLEFHQKMIHSEFDAGQFNCNECKKSFNSRQAQTLHEHWYCPYFLPERPLCNEAFKPESGQCDGLPQELRTNEEET